MNNIGIPIIGLSACSTEHELLPLQWMPHIQVADVAMSVERALRLGGSELMHGKDNAGKSRWAVLLDPNAAAFGIVPVVSQEELSASYGSASRDASAPVGCIAWLDVTVSDATATRDFYRQVVGWTAKDVEGNDASERYADYTMLGDDGNAAAGVCQARGVNLDVPPVWMLYLPVGDLAESLRRVPQEGGKIIKESRANDGEYAHAVLQDPLGVYVGLVPG